MHGPHPCPHLSVAGIGDMRGSMLAGRAIPTSELAWAKACGPGSIVCTTACQVRASDSQTCSPMSEACWKLEVWKAACVGTEPNVYSQVMPAFPEFASSTAHRSPQDLLCSPSSRVEALSSAWRFHLQTNKALEKRVGTCATRSPCLLPGTQSEAEQAACCVYACN